MSLREAEGFIERLRTEREHLRPPRGAPWPTTVPGGPAVPRGDPRFHSGFGYLRAGPPRSPHGVPATRPGTRTRL